MKTLLQVQHLHKAYGTQAVLEDVSLSLVEGQKVGFVGRNGSGKTTLLKIIIGDLEADRGEVNWLPDARVGYLEQHEHFQAGETVLEYLERRSGKPDWECAKLAAQFQLKKDLLLKPCLELSGGYQMRIKLTQMLLADPNILILDEPTNYLDVQTQILFEHFLQSFRGAFLIVSHDREFLKNTCTETLEIERGRTTLSPLPIEAYLEWKEEQREEQKKYNKKIEAQQKHLQAFVDRFRYKASLATQAQSKLKQIARLHKIDLAAALKHVRLVIPPVEDKKGVALRLQHLAIGYPGTMVAHHIDLEINRGEHVAILGENGQGKSTLLKTMAGELAALEGHVRWGHKLKILSYAQHVSQALPLADKVGNYLMRIAYGEARQDEVLRMAGNFLFSLDDLEKPISVLSGGERARLCLAGILLAKPDVLLLDEPTNHLDMETVEALAAALATFAGTVFFVSHSRTFVNNLATAILEVRDGHVSRYPGTYAEYIELLQSQDHGLTELIQTEHHLSIKQEAYQELKKKRQLLTKIEKQLADTAAEKDKLLQVFLAHPSDYLREETARLHTLNSILAYAEDEWLKVSAEIERLD